MKRPRFVSVAAVVVNGDTELYAVDTDGRMWWNTWIGGNGWGGWELCNPEGFDGVETEGT